MIRLKYMKLRKPRISGETKARVITDYNAGISIGEILKRNNISLGTLYRILKQKIKKGAV